MSKKVSILIAILAAAIVVLSAVPIPKAALDDGGTREYAALTYRIVKWKKFYAGGTYEKQRFISERISKKRLMSFGQRKKRALSMFFMRKLRRLTEALLRFVPLRARRKPQAADKIQFGTGNLERIGFNVGTVVQVTYKGGIRETYPAQINAISWKNADDLRDRDFDGE